MSGEHRTRVILFDVNETVLDLGALDPAFLSAFGKPGVRETWFLTLEEIALTSVITGRYVDFTSIARAALTMVAEQHGITLADDAAESILKGITQLPAHVEALDSLDRLRQTGFRLAALTNGTLASARKQLTGAGLADVFEAIFSADEVKRLKPAREPYVMAAERMGVPIGETLMVAAHAWDIAGAEAAGCATAFVARPGKSLNPVATKPMFYGKDLGEIARALIETFVEA